MVRTPTTAQELLARAKDLAGLTREELNARYGRIQSEGDKGRLGRVLENALGSDGGTDIDFPGLGIELKSLPVDASGVVKESTFVCHAPLRSAASEHWEGSRAQRKLSRVLFVPVEASGPLETRRIGSAFLWVPDRTQISILRSDWEHIVGMIGAGLIESIDARVGTALQLRPKGANAMSRARGTDEDGAPCQSPVRAFYLRSSFTQTIVAHAMRPS